MMKRVRWARVALLVSGIAILSAPQAGAVPVLTLTSGTNVATITDGGANDLNPLAGAITFVGAVGDWYMNVTTGQTVGINRMDLNSVDNSGMLQTSGMPDALVLEFSDTGFTPNVWPGAKLSIGGTTDGTVQFDAYWDTSNLIATVGPLSGPGAFSGTAHGNILATTPFSLTEKVTISHPAGQYRVTSFDAQLDAVPEPGSMLLLGTGLFGLAAAIRRRVRK